MDMEEEGMHQYLRGNNLAAVLVCALAGIAFLPEVIFEREVPYKIDDLVLFIIGLVAVFWYQSGRNKFSLSIIPVLLVLLGAFTKLEALFVEMKDTAYAGDDYGGVILFIVAFLFFAFLYWQGRKLYLGRVRKTGPV